MFKQSTMQNTITKAERKAKQQTEQAAGNEGKSENHKRAFTVSVHVHDKSPVSVGFWFFFF